MNEADDSGIVAIPHLSRDLLACFDGNGSNFGTHPQNVLRGMIYYDDNGNGDTEGQLRLFINTLGDYNLKIRSGSNISIDAKKLYLPSEIIWRNNYLDAQIREIAHDIAEKLIQDVIDKYFGI